MAQLIRLFPDIYVHSDPYPIQFGSGDWITVVTNVTGTFIGEMTLPDGNVIEPTHSRGVPTDSPLPADPGCTLRFEPETEKACKAGLFQ